MVRYLKGNPYDPGYALPANVLRESPGRGTLTTKQVRRRTFTSPPRARRGGFALPNYVEAERPGLDARSTEWLRRRSIPGFIPEMLGDSIPSALLRPGFRGDPIKDYGRRASEYILSTINQVPIEFRATALRGLLDEVEPGLHRRFTERRKKYAAQGMPLEEARVTALASSMSEGMAKELLKLGKGRAPSVRSQLGLGVYGEESMFRALDGIWSRIKKQAKKVGSAIASPVKKAGSAVSSGARATGRKLKEGVRYTKKSAQKAYRWSKKAASKLGSLACTVLQSPAAPAAASAAAAAYGAPPQVGAAGAQVGASLCQGKEEEVPETEAPEEDLAPPSAGLPKWVIPAALAGGAGIILLTVLK